MKHRCSHVYKWFIFAKISNCLKKWENQLTSNHDMSEFFFFFWFFILGSVNWLIESMGKKEIISFVFGLL